MFKKLKDVILGDCEVVKFDETKFIYPIFKNGRSSLDLYSIKNKLKILKNEEISKLKNITVFFRDPQERFLSGVWTFLYFTNKQTVFHDDVLKKIEKEEIIDRHFVPQYVWLFKLKKYFNGAIDLRPISELYDLIPNRNQPWEGLSSPWKNISDEEKKKILSIKNKKYVNVDTKILKKYLNQSVALEKIITEFWI